MATRIFPVSTINSYIHDVVTSDELLADIWIEGEITKISTPRSGHIYFTICEGNASIDAVMWRSAAARQRFIPSQGEAVVIHGQADFYQVQGRLQIQTDVFEHQGQGLLSLEFERLRQQLESEGLFDEARKRSLPLFPQRIGVVTSASGAVWHDIQTVSRRRFPMVELVLIPAAVQGEHAPQQIADAIQRANTLDYLDLLIVGRGGGAPEDLACFNAENVARAVFASRLPVISAVGHESDISICDLVADLRAATPSAAAELALPDAEVLLYNLADRRSRLTSTVTDTLADHRLALGSMQRRFRLQSPEHQVRRHRLAVDAQLALASKSMKHAFASYKGQLNTLSTLLSVLHPHDIMKRGFAVVQDVSGKRTIQSVSELPSDGAVVTRFHDGIAAGHLHRKQEGTKTNGAATHVRSK